MQCEVQRIRNKSGGNLPYMSRCAWTKLTLSVAPNSVQCKNRQNITNFFSQNPKKWIALRKSSMKDVSLRDITSTCATTRTRTRHHKHVRDITSVWEAKVWDRPCCGSVLPSLHGKLAKISVIFSNGTVDPGETLPERMDIHGPQLFKKLCGIAISTLKITI